MGNPYQLEYPVKRSYHYESRDYHVIKDSKTGLRVGVEPCVFNNGLHARKRKEKKLAKYTTKPEYYDPPENSADPFDYTVLVPTDYRTSPDEQANYYLTLKQFLLRKRSACVQRNAKGSPTIECPSGLSVQELLFPGNQVAEVADGKWLYVCDVHEQKLVLESVREKNGWNYNKGNLKQASAKRNLKRHSGSSIPKSLFFPEKGNPRHYWVFLAPHQLVGAGRQLLQKMLKEKVVLCGQEYSWQDFLVSIMWMGEKGYATVPEPRAWAVEIANQFYIPRAELIEKRIGDEEFQLKNFLALNISRLIENDKGLAGSLVSGEPNRWLATEADKTKRVRFYAEEAAHFLAQHINGPGPRILELSALDKKSITKRFDHFCDASDLTESWATVCSHAVSTSAGQVMLADQLDEKDRMPYSLFFEGSDHAFMDPKSRFSMTRKTVKSLKKVFESFLVSAVKRMDNDEVVTRLNRIFKVKSFELVETAQAVKHIRNVQDLKDHFGDSRPLRHKQVSNVRFASASDFLEAVDDAEKQLAPLIARRENLLKIQEGFVEISSRVVLPLDFINFVLKADAINKDREDGRIDDAVATLEFASATLSLLGSTMAVAGGKAKVLGSRLGPVAHLAEAFSMGLKSHDAFSEHNNIYSAVGYGVAALGAGVLVFASVLTLGGVAIGVALLLSGLGIAGWFERSPMESFLAHCVFGECHPGNTGVPARGTAGAFAKWSPRILPSVSDSQTGKLLDEILVLITLLSTFKITAEPMGRRLVTIQLPGIPNDAKLQFRYRVQHTRSDGAAAPGFGGRVSEPVVLRKSGCQFEIDLAPVASGVTGEMVLQPADFALVSPELFQEQMADGQYGPRQLMISPIPDWSHEAFVPSSPFVISRDHDNVSLRLHVNIKEKVEMLGEYSFARYDTVVQIQVRLLFSVDHSVFDASPSFCVPPNDNWVTFTIDTSPESGNSPKTITSLKWD